MKIKEKKIATIEICQLIGFTLRWWEYIHFFKRPMPGIRFISMDWYFERLKFSGGCICPLWICKTKEKNYWENNGNVPCWFAVLLTLEKNELPLRLVGLVLVLLNSELPRKFFVGINCELLNVGWRWCRLPYFDVENIDECSWPLARLLLDVYGAFGRCKFWMGYKSGTLLKLANSLCSPNRL